MWSLILCMWLLLSLVTRDIVRRTGAFPNTPPPDFLYWACPPVIAIALAGGWLILGVIVLVEWLCQLSKAIRADEDKQKSA